MIQNETQRKIKNKKSAIDLQEHSQESYIHLIGVLERKENSAEEILDEIMAENLPKRMKHMNYSSVKVTETQYDKEITQYDKENHTQADQGQTVTNQNILKY